MPDQITAAEEGEMHETWHVFLLYVEFTRKFPIVYELDGAKAKPNPVDSEFLPTLLFIQLVSLLDDALESYRTFHEIRFGSGENQDLYHRIELLKESLLDPASLQGLRKRRVGLAHKPTAFLDWAPLDQAIAKVEAELEHLGLVGKKAAYAFFAERSGALPSADPDHLFKYEYKCGVTRNGKPGLKFSWQEEIGQA